MNLPKIVGNNLKSTVGILLFIVVLCVLMWRCSSAHAAGPPAVVLRAGSSFGPGGYGPVLGMDFRFPQTSSLDLYAGTLLWGSTPRAATNWSWEGGVRTCRWHLCARLGAAFVQRVDAVNGTHTNFNLGLSYLWGGTSRLEGVDIEHLSNAGTSDVNLGRNAALIPVRLQ